MPTSIARQKEQLASATSYLAAEEALEVGKALLYAEKAHADQVRRSGEPYFSHVLSTALLLAEMQMDRFCLIAGLLHDVPEDTPYTLGDIEQTFGHEIARLVAGVTKLGKVRLRGKEEQQARNLRKMFLAMSEDVRVIIIKLCDRLHNMKTISYLPRKKQVGIATETIEIYAPLANRLGMADIRWQLEDLCLLCLEPKLYHSINRQLKESKGEREAKVNRFIDRIETELTQANIMARVSGRSKHLYSIYRNVYLRKKENSISNVLDSLGLRVVVQDVKDCYQALGLIHRVWRPIVGRFKDHIAIPKSNGYQSLHTGVICEDGSKLEVQIRTEEMDYMAEFGMASHWRYKGEAEEYEVKVQERMDWIHQLIDWQKEFHTAFDFVESLKLDLFVDQIFVFTPLGDVVDLPRDATPIDFAYNVHSELGNSAIGAKVNGRLVPLNYQLKNGDIVEILRSSQKRGPSRDWLEFIKTSSAKGKIRSWFKREQYDENVQSGKKRIQQELQKVHRRKFEEIPKELFEEVSRDLNYRKTEDMWAAVGYGAISYTQLLGRINRSLQQPTPDPETSHEELALPKRAEQKSSPLQIKGVGDLLVKVAPCCQPVQGDRIVGYVTRGRGITVHRLSCKNVLREKQEEPERVIPLEWETTKETHYDVILFIRCRNRPGIINDLLTAISDQNVFISAFDGKAAQSQSSFDANVSLRVDNHRQLNHLIVAIEGLPDTLSVERRK